MNKVRYDWIDVAKGILICCMLYGHVRVYGPMDGLNDEPMRIMGYASGLYGAFFMQAFFIVTGFCVPFYFIIRLIYGRKALSWIVGKW